MNFFELFFQLKFFFKSFWQVLVTNVRGGIDTRITTSSLRNRKLTTNKPTTTTTTSTATKSTAAKTSVTKSSATKGSAVKGSAVKSSAVKGSTTANRKLKIDEPTKNDAELKIPKNIKKPIAAKKVTTAMKDRNYS